MRYLSSPVSYVGIVLAVIGVAGAATFNLYLMTAKPTHDWDSEIDRIVAQYHEKKGPNSLVARASAGERVKTTADITPATQNNPDAQAAAAADATSDEEEANAQEEIAEKNAVQGTKKLNRRAGRRKDQFVPAAFVSLPKFAISAPRAAVSTIRRLW